MSEAGISGATWAEFVAKLRAAATFEEAAAATLAPMIELSAAALAEGRFGADAKVVRGMIHLRPGDGYRRLAVLEAGGRDAPAVGDGVALGRRAQGRGLGRRQPRAGAGRARRPAANHLRPALRRGRVRQPREPPAPLAARGDPPLRLAAARPARLGRR